MEEFCSYKEIGMFSQWFYGLSPEARGNVALVVGGILLLNSLHLVYGLNFLVIIASLFIMWLGFVQAGYWQWAQKFLSKHSHHDKR